jgi:hypothetical protein
MSTTPTSDQSYRFFQMKQNNKCWRCFNELHQTTSLPLGTMGYGHQKKDKKWIFLCNHCYEILYPDKEKKHTEKGDSRKKSRYDSQPSSHLSGFASSHEPTNQQQQQQQQQYFSNLLPNTNLSVPPAYHSFPYGMPHGQRTFLPPSEQQLPFRNLDANEFLPARPTPPSDLYLNEPTVYSYGRQHYYPSFATNEFFPIVSAPGSSSVPEQSSVDIQLNELAKKRNSKGEMITSKSRLPLSLDSPDDNLDITSAEKPSKSHLSHPQFSGPLTGNRVSQGGDLDFDIFSLFPSLSSFNKPKYDLYIPNDEKEADSDNEIETKENEEYSGIPKLKQMEKRLDRYFGCAVPCHLMKHFCCVSYFSERKYDSRKNCISCCKPVRRKDPCAGLAFFKFVREFIYNQTNFDGKGPEYALLSKNGVSYP